jgi:hypothetical protein
LASTNGATVQITRLTWFPLGRSADFSYVWHLFSPDNFHSCGWLHWHACGYALANKGIDTRSLQAYLGRSNIQNRARYTALASGRFKNFLTGLALLHVEGR